MTFTAWPIDGHASDSQVIRQQAGSLVAAAGGLVAAGNLELTQKATPNMSVQVAAGSCWVPGFPAGGVNPYFFNNSAAYERTIAASGTEPRVDTIVVQVKDEAYEGTGHEPVIEALKGKEETGVTLGNLKGIATVPHGCLVLGYVFVEKSATSIVTADIKNVAERAQLGLPISGANITGGLVGAWTALESLSKVEEAGSPQQTVRARTEITGAICRLRGSLKVKTGETVEEEELFATLPAGLRPPGTVVLDVNLNKVANTLVINSSGELKLGAASLGAPNVIRLDGLTFNLT
jgi:hypothetical protein